MTEWLKDKYIIFLYNRQIFNSLGFKEKKYTKESYIDWYPIDGLNQKITPFIVQYTALQSSDGIWPWQHSLDHYFNLRKEETMNYHEFPQIVSGIMIELSPNMQ